MKNKKLRKEKIAHLKKMLLKTYINITSFILGCYVLYFSFYLINSFLSYYILSALIALNLFWHLLKNRCSLEQIVTCFLIIAPLFCFTIILFFWEYTITNYVWLMCLPLGAYIYFGIRGLAVFSIYALVIIVMVPVLVDYVNKPHIEVTKTQLRVSDMFLFASNLVIASCMLYYYDKIRSLQLINKIEIDEKLELPITLDKKEIEQHKKLFDRIENLMNERLVFKNPDFNVSVLSSELKVSVSYISRAIRYQNYINFNTYLNTHRIKYVEKLLRDEDLDKITLLYIYTAAGYKNQSTFNVSFKKIIGVTPTEYIQNMKEGINKIS